MPSARRIRLLFFTALLTTLVLFYLNSGNRRTQASPFYQKTVALMHSKAQAAERERTRIAALHESERGSAADSAPVANTDSVPSWQADETLRDRLRDAEEAAKKGADEKYHQAVANAKDDDDDDDDDKDNTIAPAISMPPDHPIPPAKAKVPAPASDEKVLGVEADAPAAGAPLSPPGSAPDGARKPYPKPDGVGSPDGVAKVGNVGPGGAAEKEAAASSSVSTSISTSTSTSSTADAAAAASTETTAAEALAAAKTELNSLLARHPTLIFSKTYCPHSKRAKQILLEAHRLTPAPHVVELDTHPLGAQLQRLLAEATQRSTVPNVIVNGKSVGGGDDMQALWEVGKVGAVWERYGRGKVKVEELRKWNAGGEVKR